MFIRSYQYWPSQNQLVQNPQSTALRLAHYYSIRNLTHQAKDKAAKFCNANRTGTDARRTGNPPNTKFTDRLALWTKPNSIILIEYRMHVCVCDDCGTRIVFTISTNCSDVEWREKA